MIMATDKDINNLAAHADSERKVIHLMLRYRDAIDEMLDSGISSEFFDVAHQPLVDAIYYEYSTSNQKRLLTRETYRHCLTEQNAGGDTLLSLSVYDKCLVGVSAQKDDLGSLKKIIMEGHVSRKCAFLLKDFNHDFQKHGAIKAARRLSDDLQQCLSITETRRAVFTTLSELKEDFISQLKEKRDNPGIVVRCNIPEIDDSVNVGFAAQHLTLFVAAPGSHKSNIMLNIALNICEAGHNVLFIPLEMNRFDLTNRILANKTNIDFHFFARPEMMSDEQVKHVENATSWLMSKFCILDADERSSVSYLQKEIEKLALAFKPKVVIIDYVANLKPEVRYSQRNDIEIGEVLKSLRFVGKKHGFHIMSAAQMGRAAIKAMKEGKDDAIDSTSISGSQQYAADSDTVFALTTIAGEPDKLKVHVIKARHGPSQVTYELRLEPQYCRITSTKCSMLTDPDGITDLENDLNQSPAAIEAALSGSIVADVDFASVNLDDDMSVLG